MEYEFRYDTITGKSTAFFSCEHQIFGPWLDSEIGQSNQKLKHVLLAVSQILKGEKQELLLAGHEYSLLISADEVAVNANGLMSTTNEVPEQLATDNLNIDDSGKASCGIDDFQALLLSWSDFIS